MSLRFDVTAIFECYQYRGTAPLGAAYRTAFPPRPASCARPDRSESQSSRGRVPGSHEEWQDGDGLVSFDRLDSAPSMDSVLSWTPPRTTRRPSGMRVTNDKTGHGAVVSVERVQPF